MQTILLDTNVYTRLEQDKEALKRLKQAVDSGNFRVIATPVVIDELAKGPLGGIPDWFPVEFQAESVAVLGHWRAGQAHLGEGRTFTEHRGTSTKTRDAIIADSADTFADILVSDDRRCARRLASISSRCKAMNFQEFQAILETNEERPN